MKQIALAVGAHPDDIEFMMAGTLMLLERAGYEIHVFIVASGSCGTMTTDRETTARIRLAEAKNAAQVMKAHFHAPLVDDLEVLYTLPLLSRVGAVIREVQPDIILTHSLEEYMEDHINTCRLVVSAAFARAMPNFITDPEKTPYQKDTVLYHCLPYGLRDQFGKKIAPDFFVDISEVQELKTQALACHESQKLWLDQSQGLDSYLIAMADMEKTVGQMSGYFEQAEGWRFHNPLGFCAAGTNPLEKALSKNYYEPKP
ncbi:MAG: LmbE family protein [Candidatus Hydrogenedentes bacterium]|jgi:LmbE family N-acetylglucosaminyl deacetylase|nr:LmbE family protein [Candidatus Hydrogenedentota bacterium]